MKTSLDCMECNIKQLIKISKLFDIPEEKQAEASKKLFKMLSEISFDYSNPFIMGETWKIITEVYHNDNPYKELKKFYNKLLFDLYEEIKEVIINSENKFETALKIAVIGNIIDFGARHKFTKEDLLDRINEYNNVCFKIDDSDLLEKAILKAKSLLYIGDNCGEIVLDKLFIEIIKTLNPNLKVVFGVRGGPIINDVTIEDALDVNLQEVAEVVSSGIAIPGTIVEKSSLEFQELFNRSEVIIAKGQGNYESLSETKRDKLFLMLMVKCDYVAKILNVNTMNYVVVENK